jgi:uncharacterized protein (TIGR02300 family)
MGRPELGTKCTCAGCAERFYDLNRSPIVCPKCGAEQPPEKPRVLRPARSAFGTRYQTRQPVPVASADDDVEAVTTSEAEDDEDVADPEDEADIDADIEIEPDRAKTAD